MKVLFLCPDYFGIYKVIQKEIQAQTLCELKSVIFEDYKYKNSFQKIQNFLAKTFLRKNLKKIWASKERISTIAHDDYFDYLFVICPDFLLNDELKYVTQRAKKTIVYFWDSFDNIPRYERTLPFFDVKYSFEPKDVAKYNLNLLTNFYYNTNRNITPSNDVFFIGTFDERFELIQNVVKSIHTFGKTAQIFLQSNNEKTIAHYQTETIKFIKKPITFAESEKIYNNSKIILDVQKKIQKGLTFRVFEAMGKGKKLITTNEDIVNYDFYNSNNIFIWKDQTTAIPNSFFETPYTELPQEIYEKYSISSWVKTIFEK
ncbi:hypothetical protein [Flavobacterium sp.]|uniref:hypothetical protein n=1 Tax=Flavobacterium sp. TaxID=239 RepID=UPI003750156B